MATIFCSIKLSKNANQLCESITKITRLDHSFKIQKFTENSEIVWMRASCLQYSFRQDFKILGYASHHSALKCAKNKLI